MTIYLDHAATTPVHPDVREAMMPYLTEECGNTLSLHKPGRRTKKALEEARECIAAFIGVKPHEIVFTSSGSESNNMAIKGVLFASKAKGNHIITSCIEHHSVLEPCHFMESLGFKVTFVPADEKGLVDPDEVKRAITSHTILISIMHANNEIGTIESIAAIARIAHEYGVLMHTDAVQTFGHHPTLIKDMGVDLMSVSAHKLYGPKGVGLLYVGDGISITPLIHGGGQERHMRAGTHNIAGIVGLGKAVACAHKRMAEDAKRIGSLRDQLQATIVREIEGTIINGHEEHRLPGILSVTIPGIDADALLLGLDRRGIFCSSGAACMSSHFEPSHVLTAIGRTRNEAKATIRISLGRGTTEDNIVSVTKAIQELVAHFRKETVPESMNEVMRR